MSTAFPGCGYVAQGQNGLMKIGYSKNPKARRRSLLKEFRKRGDELVRFWHCEQIDRPWCVEYRLIDFCRANYAPHSGREWYIGADFETLMAVAKRATDEYRHMGRDYFDKPLPPPPH